MFQCINEPAGLVAVRKLRVLENVGGSAGINLQVLFPCLDGHSHLVKYQVHHLAVDACIAFKLADNIQIDVLYGQPVQAAVKQDVQVKELLVAEIIRNINHGVLDDIAFHHHNHQKLMLLHLGKLDELKLCLVITGAADHGRVIGIGCQHLGHLL